MSRSSRLTGRWRGAGVAGLALLATTVPSALRAQAGPARLAIGAEWLHANADALGRDALPSLAVRATRDVVAGPVAGWRVGAGFLRAARETSTIQGLTASLARPLTAGRLSVAPGAALLAGRYAGVVADGGYDWRGVDGTWTGQQGTQAFRGEGKGTAIGAGLVVDARLDLVAGIALGASVQQWAFSGRPLAGDRGRTLAGLGLTIRPGATLGALRGGDR